MKGDITLRVLEAVARGALEITTNMVDVIDVLLRMPYGSSLSKMNYELSRLESRRAGESVRRMKEFRLRQRYTNLISRLKRDGLIVEEKKSGKRLFALTPKGKIKISSLKLQTQNPLPRRSYEKGKSGTLVIVVFDIPESERRKRWWLRESLKQLGLKMLQKSVWAGKVKFPKEFLDDLAKLRLTEYVEIFEITKTGSLEHVM